MEKINIAELLRDCPSGMKLDCTMYNNLYFNQVCDDDGCLYPIGCYTIADGIRTSINFTEFGEFNTHMNSKCVIFPEGKTTWEGFVPPCQFKDGDILSYQCAGLRNRTIYIYRHHPTMNTSYYAALGGDLDFMVSRTGGYALSGNNTTARLATKDEKEKLFQAIKDKGYRWNEETKTLETLNQPKFKVGDRIRRKNGNDEYTITRINDYTNYYRLNEHCAGSLGIHLQDEYELVPDKFDVNTLKPLQPVLVRNTNGQVWSMDFFSHKIDTDKRLQTSFVCVGHHCPNQCIPYEGNEHLRGKTDDCDECFKTWE